jgi:hypothetical protein
MKPGDMVLYTYSSFVSGSRWKTEVGLILKELPARNFHHTKFYQILRSSGSQIMVAGSSIKPI